MNVGPASEGQQPAERDPRLLVEHELAELRSLIGQVEHRDAWRRREQLRQAMVDHATGANELSAAIGGQLQGMLGERALPGLQVDEAERSVGQLQQEVSRPGVPDPEVPALELASQEDRAFAAQ